MSELRKPVKVVRKNSDSRQDREWKDRDITENREYTDSERVAMLGRTFFQSALPDLPKIPGYHVCWITTQNSRDPVHGRLRLGYQLIQAHEVPGFELMSSKSAEFPGVISVNEMLAAKLPKKLYKDFMTEVHFKQPREEEEAIFAAAQRAAEEAAQAAQRGGRMKGPMIEVGTQELGQARELPDFLDEQEQRQ
jgi:hypothetical protein